MQQTNPTNGSVTENIVVGSIKVIETAYKVRQPVFEDEIVKRPIFEDYVVKVPVGYDAVVNELALEISKGVMAIVELGISKQLKMLEEKIASLSNINTKEEVIIKTREVEVEKPVYKDVEVQVTRPVYVDKEVINPVLKDTEIVNSIVIDKAVTNCVVTDIRVTNAIIRDVEVERAVIREKVIEVIHKNCFDEKGNPL